MGKWISNRIESAVVFCKEDEKRVGFTRENFQGPYGPNTVGIGELVKFIGDDLSPRRLHDGTPVLDHFSGQKETRNSPFLCHSCESLREA